MADFKPRRIIIKLKELSGNIFSTQLGVFLIFLGISTLLWLATTLNEEVQRNVDCEIEVTNIPDSVTFITPPPTSITANVRARGTKLLKNIIGPAPVIKIDFRYYNKHNRFSVPKRILMDFVYSALGDDLQIVDITPDSIGVFYTTLPPIRVPVKVDVNVTTTPNVCLYGPVKSTTDSVSVYAVGSVASGLYDIRTVKTDFTNIGTSRTARVALAVPAGCRAIPDSVDVTINIEPVVTEVRLLEIEAVNVPAGSRVVFAPARVKASYRMPQSKRYQLPEVHVIADMSSLNEDLSNEKVAIRTSQLLPNVFLDIDSVSYYIGNQNSTDTTSFRPN